jgi:hypothetical protein
MGARLIAFDSRDEAVQIAGLQPCHHHRSVARAGVGLVWAEDTVPEEERCTTREGTSTHTPPLLPPWQQQMTLAGLSQPTSHAYRN